MRNLSKNKKSNSEFNGSSDFKNDIWKMGKGNDPISITKRSVVKTVNEPKKCNDNEENQKRKVSITFPGGVTTKGTIDLRFTHWNDYVEESFFSGIEFVKGLGDLRNIRKKGFV